MKCSGTPPSFFQRAALIPNTDGPVLELVDVVCAEVEAKLGSALMKMLMSAVPLADLKLDHLKRIHKNAATNHLRIILTSAPDEPTRNDTETASGFELAASSSRSESPDSLLARLPSNIRAIAAEHGLKPFLVPVPRHAPHTRTQWADWCKVWPLSWRPPEPHLLQTKYNVSDELQAYFERHMTAAQQRARAAGPSACAQRGCGVSNACVLVDPVTDRMIAEARDETALHPLRHAAMAVRFLNREPDDPNARCTLPHNKYKNMITVVAYYNKIRS